MPFVLILFPLILAGVAALVPSNRARPLLLPLAAIVHLGILLAALLQTRLGLTSDWLASDPPGKLVLLLLSVLFLICSIYSIGYLRHREDRPNRIFCIGLLVFLSTTTLVTCAQHLGLMWVAMEATTLATAPLIFFNRTPKSIEATWKYLLLSSVGIALALLGSFFLAYSAVGSTREPSLIVTDLLAQAAETPGAPAATRPSTQPLPSTTEPTAAASTEAAIVSATQSGKTPGLSRPWLEVAFVLLLVGYGTKMGLAPMHTWKPDAYGEAPGVVGALLAGGVTNCAFLILLRVHHICAVAGAGAYTDKLLIFMGLLSMGVAGAFMVDQRDFKRMLAYSSVEHMGILVLGLGIGGVATFGTLLHMLNNGITKGVLFLSAGNIHRAYENKTTDAVRGAMRRLPLSGTIFLLGFFAITGSPPFGPFISEFTILTGAFAASRYLVASLFLLFLLVVFIGMGRTVLTVVQGRPPSSVRRTPYRDGLLTGLPIIISLGIVLLLGLYIPSPLRNMLTDAAKFLEVRP